MSEERTTTLPAHCRAHRDEQELEITLQAVRSIDCSPVDTLPATIPVRRRTRRRGAPARLDRDRFSQLD